MDYVDSVLQREHIFNLLQGSLYLNIGIEYFLKGLIISPFEDIMLPSFSIRKVI